MPENPPKLRPVTEWLDDCDFDADWTCKRCKKHLSEPLKGKEFVSCSAGRKHQVGWSFWCPRCRHYHVFYTAQSQSPRVVEKNTPTWQFDGNVERPTFYPSLLNTGDATSHRCHLFLSDGVIEYCDDCSHPFRGQKITLGSKPPEY